MSQIKDLTSRGTLLGKQHVARILRSRILAGELRKGQSLPSERDLSKELSVGRTVVRQALAMLGDEGLVASRGVRLRTVSYDTPDEQSAWISRSIALLIPSLGDVGSGSTQSRWLRYLTMGLMDYLRSRNIHSITLSSQGAHLADAKRIASCKPMGMLVLERAGADFDIAPWADIFSTAGVPVVCFGGHESLSRFDRVISNHAEGSYALTKLMINRGCRHIVEFWPKPWDRYWFVARHEGYCRAMNEAGLTPCSPVEFPYVEAPTEDPALFDYSVKQVAGFMLDVMKGPDRPDAMLMGTDRDVCYAAAAVRRLGLKPNADVMICGYDHYWATCEERAFEATPPFATIDKENEQMGREMVNLLFDRAQNSRCDKPVARVVTPRLIKQDELI